MSTARPRQTEWSDPTLLDSYVDYSYHQQQYDYSAGDDGNTDLAEEVEVGPICVYGAWGAWETCSRACGSGMTSRERVLTEGPAEVCTHLTHVRSCFGRTCQVDTQLVVKETATLLPGKFSSHRNKKEYEVRSNLKNFTEEENADLYCVRYHVVQAARACLLGQVEWTGLQQGGEVCALCTSKAVREADGGCVGSGLEGRITAFKMLLHTRCYGSFRKLRDMDLCDCDETSSFIFV